MSQKFFKFTSESLSASYIPFPRFLMEDSLAGLSNDAKVLYALMLDRASISKVNGFLETDGTIRIYFTVEQAQKKLHRSRQCATRVFRELEYSGLIIRKKQRTLSAAVQLLLRLFHGEVNSDGAVSFKKTVDF